MNTQNSTETTVINELTMTPIETVMKIRQVKAKIIVCPAMMLANKRIINANGLVKTPKNSTNGMMGNGNFKNIGTLGQKMSTQYAFVAKRLTAMNVHAANTNVMAMLPVTFAPPGKIGMTPIKLLIRIKKNTVSK